MLYCPHCPQSSVPPAALVTSCPHCPQSPCDPFCSCFHVYAMLSSVLYMYIMYVPVDHLIHFIHCATPWLKTW